MRDLDGGGPEVLVDFYTGGAHCCAFTDVYFPAGERYRPTVVVWGSGGYRVRDLGRDGAVEFVSRDPRFAYEFSAFASSLEPIRIWRFSRGRLRDLTRSFPADVAGDARSTLRLYQEARKTSPPEVRGILAAYLADEYLLGKSARGWALVRKAYADGEFGWSERKDGYPAGRSYLARLRIFLRRTGYAG